MEPPKNDPQRGGSIVICLSAEVKLNTGSVGVKASKSKPTNAQKAVKKVETSAEEVYTDEVPRTFEDRSSASNNNALDALCCEAKADVQADTEAKDREPCNRVPPSGDPKPFEPEGKTRINNGGTANDFEGVASTTTKDGKNSKTPVLQECSAHENGADKEKDLVKYLSGVEHVTESDEVNGTSENLADCQSKEFGSAELRLASRASDVVREKSEIELEYDMVDPLEGSLHVAIEVEKEAVDCREGSCSSDGSPESVSQRPDNTASETETRTCVQEELSKEVPSEEKLSTKNSELSQPASCAEKKADESVTLTQEIEYSQVTSVSHEPADAGKNVWTFDLNEEVCMEMDGLEKQISTPIPVASASRATTAAGMQGAPFHFEGYPGWRGSTAARGFRAASPCQVPEVDKGLSVGESSNSSKQRDECLDIDLNNDDSLNEIMVDPLTGTHNRDPSGLPSGKSADAASLRKSERVFLDLNCVTDDVEETSDWKAEGQLHLTNGHHNRSPSSSSSSKQHSFKNFDLNDQPSFGTEFSGHPNFIMQHQSYNTSVAKKIDDSMISIMGMRVEVNKTTSNSFPFGRNPTPQPPLDANLARAAGLTGIGSAVPFSQSSSAMYGPGWRLPYMLDSRVAPASAFPQVMGAAPPALQPTFSQPHYMTSMASIPISRDDGHAHAGVSLDLNSGLMPGGNRDNGGLTRQFLSIGKERAMDDRLMSPPTALVVGKKRREADSGWELEPYPFKHHQQT